MTDVEFVEKVAYRMRQLFDTPDYDAMRLLLQTRLLSVKHLELLDYLCRN